MRSVTLAAGLDTSALAFGCAELLQGPSRAARRRLLEAALDAGIRHFDAAPMYALGRAESELGAFARSRRDQVVVATKFGIDPTAPARLLGHVYGPPQRLLERSPRLRERVRPAEGDARAGAVGSILYRASGYDAEAARRSLERSLRRLRTDHVDLLLLHDPHPGDVHSDDVRAYLEGARDEGLIGAWGVAGEADATLAAARALGGEVPVLQVRDDILSRSRRHLGQELSGTMIAFGTLARPLRRILAHVRSDETVTRRWRERIGIDCTRADELASLLLRDAAAEKPAGVVLFSTTRTERIAAAAAAVGPEPRPDPQLDALRELVSAELESSAAAG